MIPSRSQRSHGYLGGDLECQHPRGVPKILPGFPLSLVSDTIALVRHTKNDIIHLLVLFVLDLQGSELSSATAITASPLLEINPSKNDGG
jgi:hypothetical protein